MSLRMLLSVAQASSDYRWQMCHQWMWRHARRPTRRWITKIKSGADGIKL